MEQRKSGFKIFKEVWGNFKIIFNDYHLVVLKPFDKCLVQSPAVVPSNFEVAFEFFLCFWDLRFTLIRLLNENNIIAVATNFICCFGMPTILQKYKRDAVCSKNFFKIEVIVC